MVRGDCHAIRTDRHHRDDLSEMGKRLYSAGVERSSTGTDGSIGTTASTTVWRQSDPETATEMECMRTGKLTVPEMKSQPAELPADCARIHLAFMSRISSLSVTHPLDVSTL